MGPQKDFYHSKKMENRTENWILKAAVQKMNQNKAPLRHGGG